MDFELSDDQVALVEGIRSLLQGRFGIDAVRALEASDGVERIAWRELAETGVFSLVLSEDDGGVGLGYADAVLVFEELGRALVPGPIVHTFLAAGLVDGAASGDAIVGLIERPSYGPAFVEHLPTLDIDQPARANGGVGFRHRRRIAAGSTTNSASRSLCLRTAFRQPPPRSPRTSLSARGRPTCSQTA